jgi:hypothetical protein
MTIFTELPHMRIPCVLAVRELLADTLRRI